jgi:quinol monooxygenase YgiN
MTTQDSFVVVTQLTYEPGLKNRVMELINNSFPVFRRQEGLISITIHHHLHEPKTMSYLVWESEEDHLNCIKSADFTSAMSSWDQLIQNGQAQFELNTYSVIDTYARHANAIF